MVKDSFNQVVRKEDAERNLATGLIDYTTFERSIEYEAIRGDHDVVLMGEEILTPIGRARFAGEKIRRRTTEVWTDISGQWVPHSSASDNLSNRVALERTCDTPSRLDADTCFPSVDAHKDASGNWGLGT